MNSAAPVDPASSQEAEIARASADDDNSVAKGIAGLSIVETDLDGPDRHCWDDYLRQHQRASLYHSSAWHCVLKQAFRHQSYHLRAVLGNQLAGVLPLVRLRSRLFGDYMVSIPFVNYGGAIADDPSIEAALMKAAATRAQRLRIEHIEFRDSTLRDTTLPVRTDKVALHLDLDPDPEAMRKRFGSKLRAQIRRPLQAGAYTKVGGIELLEDFYKVLSRNMRDLGTPLYTKRFFALVLESFESQTDIIVVYIGSRPTAAGLLLTHGTRTEIPWASSLREFNRESVNMLLYDACIARACERRSMIFDFGRSSIDSGTFRFKKQWGASPVQLYWYYWLSQGRSLPRLTPDNPKYRLAISAWKKLPMSLVNLIGPGIVRYLP